MESKSWSESHTLGYQLGIFPPIPFDLAHPQLDLRFCKCSCLLSVSPPPLCRFAIDLKRWGADSFRSISCLKYYAKAFILTIRGNLLQELKSSVE